MNELHAPRHTLAHILAEAVGSLYPGTKYGIGPALDDGFYYDFDLPKPITPEDFKAIEDKMTAILKEDRTLTCETLPDKAAALALFADEPYKCELIRDLPEDAAITIYRNGEGKFFDLCKGPHFEESTRKLLGWGFKIHSVAGAYWRGSEQNPMLTRLYVYAFPSKAELKAHITKIEEAQKRDHRKQGPALDLFFIADSAPGMPYWLPNGLKVFNTLLDFWRREHEARGYQEISAPLLNHVDLWKTSGHWDHYRDNMFIVSREAEGETDLALKPMNCPNAMVVYGRKVRSYRELPLRFSDCDTLHRDELTGALHGLFRVRTFHQDDSHNFLTPDQIEAEINQILDIADKFYGIFGLEYHPTLSTRPADFMGDIALWDKAEAVLKTILDTRYGDGYAVNEGDGAFYGPKIDLVMTDALGRPWQTGTIQLDFQLPHNFGLTYTDRDGARKEPVVIHRVIYGSLERFIGILIEHFNGAFPFWLAPMQVGVVPVRTEHNAHAAQLAEQLTAAGLRVQTLTQDEPMGGKIKQFRLAKVPYVLVVGDKEVESKTVAVRVRTGTQVADVPFGTFLNAAVELDKTQGLDLVEGF